MKDKILGWWLYVMLKIVKLSAVKQFIMYTVVCMAPAVSGLFFGDTSISVMIVAYLACVYAFFVGGFRMVGNGNTTKD